MNTPPTFDAWGIVEVMGHKRFAGHITEQQIAGAALVRVDVPEVTNRRGETVSEYSKLIGVGSVYCITPTTEEVARKAARELANYDADPLPVYIPEERQLPASTSHKDDDDEKDFGFEDELEEATG